MRKPLLEDSFSSPANLTELENAPHVMRRQFLKTVGVAVAGLALLPNIALAQNSDITRWRDRVNGFVYSVCKDDRRARYLISRLDSTRLQWRAPTTDFHYYYASPIIFAGGAIISEEVICGNGFEVNQFPFYDARCPCESINDLNAFEIRSVTNPSEVAEYGCVLAPHGKRRPVEHADHANYRRIASRSYNLDPDEFEPEYGRVFRGNGHTVRGYQIAHKTQVGANGKPAKTVILDSNDI